MQIPEVQTMIMNRERDAPCRRRKGLSTHMPERRTAQVFAERAVPIFSLAHPSTILLAHSLNCPSFYLDDCLNMFLFWSR